jgi:hypothetical protein
MQIPLPSGTTWRIENAATKLLKRGELPGARVFDLVGQSLAEAKEKGVGPKARLYMALPASWLVNSPAISRVLRRWALDPHRETCLALLETLEAGPEEWATDETRSAVRLALTTLGSEPYVIEAVSKVFALLIPERVPLMPPLARAFVLGEGAKDEPGAFAAMVEWFGRAAQENGEELEAIAREHREVRLSGAGVLDRLLWFDSDGHTRLK